MFNHSMVPPPSPFWLYSLNSILLEVTLNEASQYLKRPSILVESLTNQEEVELRAKIEALGLEVTKVPKVSADLNEMEIARELDKLSGKLDHVDELISSVMAQDPEVRALLSSTADVWMPVITATSDERRNFTAPVKFDNHEAEGKDSN